MESEEVKVAKIEAAMDLANAVPYVNETPEFKKLRIAATKWLTTQFEGDD